MTTDRSDSLKGILGATMGFSTLPREGYEELQKIECAVL